MHRVLMNTKEAKGLDAFREDIKGIRYGLKNIYIGTDNCFYSANGAMVLRIQNNYAGTLARGKAYEILRITKHSSTLSEMVLEEKTDQYPDVESIFKTCKTDNSVGFINIKTSCGVSRAIIQIYDKTKNALNLKYLNIISKIHTKWGAYSLEDDKGILLKFGVCSVIILPFQL